MLPFRTATEHGVRGGEGGWGGGGAASSAFTVSEATARGILWKEVFLKILQNF